MRYVFVFIAALTALAACGQGGAPAGGGAQQAAAGAVFPVGATAYRIEATLQGPNGAAPLIMQADGPRLRVEFGGAPRSTIITNTETGESISLVEIAGRTVAMRSDVGAPSFQDPLDGWKGEAASNATPGGPCSGAGESGTSWTQTTDGVPQTACVTHDGIMLSVASGGQTVWQTTSIQRGPQPASAFELPPGVQLVDPNDVGAMVEMFGGGRRP